MNRNLASMALLALASLSSANLFLINSTDPYLRANGENPFTPNAIDLNANGFFAGQTVRLSRVGSYNHLGGATPTDYGLTAVFSSTNVILPPPLLNRIPGAIDAGPDWTSPNTFVGGLPTDISEDFMVDNLTGTANGITLVIPVGAQFIFASAIDDFFSDNNNTREFYLSIRPVPEPTTILILGLGSVALLCRRQKK